MNFAAELLYNDKTRRVYWGGGGTGNSTIRGLAIEE